MIRNITMSAEEKMIALARRKALSEHKSLNLIFREWLERYTQWPDRGDKFRNTMKKLQYANPGRKFGRDELNER